MATPTTHRSPVVRGSGVPYQSVSRVHSFAACYVLLCVCRLRTPAFDTSAMSESLERAYRCMWQSRMASNLSQAVVPHPSSLPHIIVAPSLRRVPIPTAAMARQVAAAEREGQRDSLASQVGSHRAVHAAQRLRTRLHDECLRALANHQASAGTVLEVTYDRSAYVLGNTEGRC